MADIIIGLLVVGLWGVVIYFSANLTQVFGRNAWAERNLGWTRNAIILFWFVMMIFGVMMMFGMLDGFWDTSSSKMWGLW